jgi:methionine sulfoxide reductase heme-binding subunit
MIHATGLWSVRFMLITLAITPIARMLDFSRLLLVRRIVGIAALAYALTHLGLYIADQKFVLAVVVSEIALRFYLTVGFLAVIGLAALVATSTDESVRRLGRRWKTCTGWPIRSRHWRSCITLSKAKPTFPSRCSWLVYGCG